MKLLLENWRRFLAEEQEGEGVLLYHGTCFPPESFTGGIDPTRAKGYGQGEGFYFFTKKINAVNHANSLIDGSVSKEEVTDCSRGAYIIVSDEPVTPDTFDIDYEIFASGIINWIFQNPDIFPPNTFVPGPKYGIRLNPEKNTVSNLTGEKFFFPANISFRSAQSSVIVSEESAAEGISVIAAKKVYGGVKVFAEARPEIFKKFEEQFLSKASAIKYNGKEKIIPLRIEDLEGNVVWSRE
jgi:uncharacterized protein YqkB